MLESSSWAGAGVGELTQRVFLFLGFVYIETENWAGEPQSKYLTQKVILQKKKCNE